MRVNILIKQRNQKSLKNNISLMVRVRDWTRSFGNGIHFRRRDGWVIMVRKKESRELSSNSYRDGGFAQLVTCDFPWKSNGNKSLPYSTSLFRILDAFYNTLVSRCFDPFERLCKSFQNAPITIVAVMIYKCFRFLLKSWNV